MICIKGKSLNPWWREYCSLLFLLTMPSSQSRNPWIVLVVRPGSCARCMPAWMALSRSWRHGPSPDWRPSGDAPPCTSWPEPGPETLSRCTWWQPSGVDPAPWRTCRSEGSVSRGRRTCLGAWPGLELARSVVTLSIFLCFSQLFFAPSTTPS